MPRMVKKVTSLAPPCHIGGGRSTRYVKRRRAPKGVRYSAEWSDAAAAAVLQALHIGCKASGETLTQHVLGVLSGVREVEDFVSRRLSGLGPQDRDVARMVLSAHKERVNMANGGMERKRRARAFLKPLRERHASRTPVGTLEVPCSGVAWSTFHDRLSPN